MKRVTGGTSRLGGRGGDRLSRAHSGWGRAAVVLISAALAGQATADFIQVGPGDSIQAAIDDAFDGDLVLVAPGIYLEAIDFLGKAVTVRGIEGPKATVIDATGRGRPVASFVSGESAASVLVGFTLTGGTGDISTNIAKGGGIFVLSGSPAILNCIITGNTARVGAGMFTANGGSPTIGNCIFYRNTAEANGGGLFCTLSHPVVSNCTFIFNRARGSGGGMVVFPLSSPTVTNSVFWLNADGGHVDGAGQMHVPGGTPLVKRCCIQDGLPGVAGADVIDADPLFADPVRGDLRLGAGSPCIDAGNNADVVADLADLDRDGDTTEPIPMDLAGHPRFMDDPMTKDSGQGEGPIVDLGAIEYEPGALTRGLGRISVGPGGAGGPTGDWPVFFGKQVCPRLYLTEPIART